MTVTPHPALRTPHLSQRHAWIQRSALFSVLITLLLPALAVVLAQRLWIRRKGLVGLREKLSGRGPAPRPDGVLVHGVSLGEVNLMRPLVPRLEAALGARCVLSTTTETGRAQLDQAFPGHERVFFPLDLPWAVAAFLRRTRPRLVVLLELELWPLFLCACALRGVPVVLLNARLSARSFRGYGRGGALLRPLFASLALVLAQNGTWAARLAALGARPGRVRVGGSMKADMVRPADAAAAAAEAARLGLRAGQPVLLLASTSAGPVVEERAVLSEGWAQWQERGWQVVICPRHIERADELVALAGTLGTVPRRSSRGERVDGAGQLLIVDEIGRLGALYAWTAAQSGIAIVGGSLGSGRGGQNMLEAAAAGCCTAVGPDTRNFPDAMALLRQADGVVELAPSTLQATLTELAADPAHRARLGEAGQRAWAAGLGAVERAVSALAAFQVEGPGREVRGVRR
jgi:3-deoxy-D-manno-octulosonic-acid transferase